MLRPGTRYILVATFLFVLMNVGVKALPHIPAHEIVFFRAWISLVLCWLWLRRRGISPWGKNHAWLIGRGLAGTGALLCYFRTLQGMPLASAVTLQYLSPIFSVAFGWLLLGEKVGIVEILCFGLSFLGIALVKGFDPRVSGAMVALGLAGAACSGCAYAMVRRLRETDPPLVVVFYFPLVTLPLIGPYTLLHWVPPVGWDWALLLWIGILTQLAQVYLTKALQADRVSNVAIFNYLGMFYALFLGWAVFGEAIPWLAGVGLLLTLAGVALHATVKNRAPAVT